MKPPGLSTGVWLLALGATATLLIGAFARFVPSPAPNTAPAASALSLAPQPDQLASAGDPILPADLSPGLAEIIRLAQAHVDQGVILAYIQKSGQNYNPTAEEILYLSDLGLPQNVIAALYKNDPPAAPAIAAAPPPIPDPNPPSSPPPTPDASFFYDDLSHYGAWVQTPDYGLSWQPTVETIDSDWSPYLDNGQWLDSENGWFWLSDYTWGWAPFHYGRWVREPHLGWVWLPDNVWAPAWVAWRSTGAHFGWAPLPPGAILNRFGQLTFVGALGTAAAIPPSSFVFVNAENFLNRNLRQRAVPTPRAATLFAQSALVGNYSLLNDKVINGGISRESVAAATGKIAKPITLRSVSSPTALAGVSARATQAVYRPDPSPVATETAPQSATFLIHKAPLRPAATPSATQEEPALLADAFPEVPSLSPVTPPTPGTAPPIVQLPPLRSTASPAWHSKNLASTVATDDPAAPRLAHRQRQARLDPVARPSTPPPPTQSVAPAAEPRRTYEQPRFPQSEPARPEPPRAEVPPSRPISTPSPSAPSSIRH